MQYRYETHLHTCQGSACGVSTGAEHVRAYKDAGYQGIFVTDHFFGGNSAAMRHGEWKNRIDSFCAGFEDAWNEGQKVGLDVFFGWEESFDGDDYLIYGLDKQFLVDRPEMENWTRRQQFDAVHAAGGCIIQAHPFRMRSYIWAIHLGDALCDGWEVANAGNTPQQDAYALHYAKKHGLYMTAGSDNHWSLPNYPKYGVGLEKKLDSAADWVAHVLHREEHTLLCPRDRWDMPPQTERLIRTMRVDADDKVTLLSGDWQEW